MCSIDQVIQQMQLVYSLEPYYRFTVASILMITESRQQERASMYPGFFASTQCHMVSPHRQGPTSVVLFSREPHYCRHCYLNPDLSFLTVFIGGFLPTLLENRSSAPAEKG